MRRTYLRLSFVDEERVFAKARADGFCVLSKHLQTPDLRSATWERLPTQEEAADCWWDYDCAIVPTALVEKVHPRAIGPSAWIEAGRSGKARGSQPPSPFTLSETDVPMLSWERGRPRFPGGELSVLAGWDFGPLQDWLADVVREYERLTRWIKRSAERELLSASRPPVYRYVSADTSPPRVTPDASARAR